MAGTFNSPSQEHGSNTRLYWQMRWLPKQMEGILAFEAP